MNSLVFARLRNLALVASGAVCVIGAVALLRKSCWSPPKRQFCSADTASGHPIVFIHGIKGCHLFDYVSSNQVYLTTTQLLALSTPDLRLPLEWSDEGKQQMDSIRPGPPLHTLLGCLPVYGELLDWGAKTFGSRFHVFTYDWRRDLLETSANFEYFIRQVSQAHGGQPVQIISHSMGGLIAWPLVDQHPELIHSIVFAGVPFVMGIGFLNDIHDGIPTGVLNYQHLGPDVLFTFGSLWSFFPVVPDPDDPEKIDRSRVLDGNTRQPVPIDWGSAEEWEKQQMAMFRHRNLSDSERAQCLNHLRHVLSRAKTFRSTFFKFQGPASRYPPIAVLKSGAHPTVNAALRFVSEDGKSITYDLSSPQVPRTAGDARVCYNNAHPPPGVPHMVFETQLIHHRLLSDVKLLGDILQKLNEAREAYQVEQCTANGLEGK